MTGSVRTAGALVAGALWVPVTIGLLLTQDPRGIASAVAGLLTTPVVGGLLAPKATTSRGLGIRTAVLFAAIAVPVGSLVFGLVYAVGDGRSPIDALGLGLVAFIFLGIPLLILGTLLALLWIPLVRRAS